MFILDGKKINQGIASELKEAISDLKRKPKLAIIQVGDEISSNIYIKKKIEFAEKIGATVVHKKIDQNLSSKDLLDLIIDFNRDIFVNGIIVQLPIPNHFDQKTILQSISKEKDVDGMNQSSFSPAVSRGIVTLLEKNNIKIVNQKIVIINNSESVGKPTAAILEKKGAGVENYDKDTKNLKEKTKQADIIITAIGQPEIIDESYLSEGQIVIDVGISRKNQKICGDLKKNLNLELKAYSPVPGGVGPMTVASLFENLLDAYQMQQK